MQEQTQSPQTQNPGMSPAILEALKRRGMTGGTPTLSQTSPDARTPNMTQQPQSPSQVSAGMPQGQAPKQGFQVQTQDDLIIETLSKQLSRNNQLEKEKIKVNQVPQMKGM